MRTFKSNPGGQIDPEQAIGRDALCADCWRKLNQQSLLLRAERRIGKTTIIRKLMASAPTGVRTIFRDVGGSSTTTEFVELVIEDVETMLADKKGFGAGIRKYVSSLAGFEIAGVLKIPETATKQWKVILENCFKEAHRVYQDPLVLFWDELPWMLQKIKSTQGESAAIDLLDTLRGIRQTYKNVRMVYTGSIGLHHVLTALEEKGQTSAPVNDMAHVDVPALETADALKLASELLLGEGIKVDDLPATAQKIQELSGSIAFYIHQIVSQLVPKGTATPAAVEAMVATALNDPNDPWALRHFDTRLVTYYEHQAPWAREILDLLANSVAGQSFEALQKHVGGGSVDRTQLTALLRKMQQDHYLVRNEGNRSYSFLLPLIQRWWRLYRDL